MYKVKKFVDGDGYVGTVEGHEGRMIKTNADDLCKTLNQSDTGSYLVVRDAPDDGSTMGMLFLFACLVTFIIGVCLALVGYTSFFGRLGALVTFFGGSAEYVLAKGEMSRLYQEIENKSKLWLNDGYGNIAQGTLHTVLTVIAHVTVVVGTITWGFGDCMFPTGDNDFMSCLLQ